MLQSQKRFEYNADFWEMRWGMKELAEGDTVMASCRRRQRLVDIEQVNVKRIKPPICPQFWICLQLDNVPFPSEVNYHGKGRWVTGTITRVNKGNGAYDVDYMHGGNDRKVPTNLVRPKDKSAFWLQANVFSVVTVVLMLNFS